MKNKIEKIKIPSFYCSEITELAHKINHQIIDHLNSEADSQEETPKERWKPEEGEEFWYFEMDGEIHCGNHDNLKLDKDMYNFGNVFRTEKEAEEARDKIKRLLNEL